jgi:uncharacterized membrane protein
MTTLTAPRRFSLLVLLVSAVCLIAAAVTSNTAVDVVAGVPLGLFLPGAALVAALDPWSRRVNSAQRAMWSVGASIGMVILGGLILNLTGGLTRAHWLILLAIVTLLAAAVSWFRSTASAAIASEGESSRSSQATGRWTNSLSLRQGALFLAALAIVAAAMVLSQRTNAESSREQFVQAWLLPQPTSNVYSPTVKLGVTNEEGTRTTIIVHVRVGSSTASTWTISLNNGQTWTHGLSRDDGERVTASVALASNPSAIVDRLDLAKPA